jgi:hypothetical protein
MYLKVVTFLQAHPSLFWPLGLLIIISTADYSLKKRIVKINGQFLLSRERFSPLAMENVMVFFLFAAQMNAALYSYGGETWSVQCTRHNINMHRQTQAFTPKVCSNVVQSLTWGECERQGHSLGVC